jgi:hypothetical protein
VLKSYIARYELLLEGSRFQKHYILPLELEMEQLSRRLTPSLRSPLVILEAIDLFD